MPQDWALLQVCQSKKRTRRANLAQATHQNEQDTHIDECGMIQPNPPVVNMLKIVNHIGTTSGTQEKHLKFPIDVDVRGPYKHHLVVRVDTGADVNEKTFRRLFPKVKLDVCPYEIQNFGNSTADISILGQFQTYLQFRGKKYLNTFIVTNANDCPNLLSHGATFRMGVLLPNYLEENVVKGDKVPNFKIGTPTSTSNVFQILQDLWLKQYQGNSEPRAHRPSITAKQPKDSMTHEQPVRIQVWPHILIICLEFRLLAGPYHLPILHTVQDDQPLKDIKMDIHLAVCMYTSCRVKSASWKNR